MGSWICKVSLLLGLLFCLAGVALAQGPLAFERQGFKGWEPYGPGGPVTDRLRASEDSIASLQVGYADAYAGSLLWGNYRYETTLTARKYGSPHSGIRLFFRLIGPWEGYGISIGGSGTTLSRFDGGYDLTQSLGFSSQGLREGETATFAIEVEGSEIKVYRNGSLIIQARDRQDVYPYGFIGMRTEYSDMLMTDFRIQGTEVADPEHYQRAKRFLGPPIEMPQGEFLAASDPRTGGARDILLVYEQAGNMTWMSFDALPYVGYMQPDYSISDWFFDTFMFVAGYAPQGRNFASGNPAVQEDWIWWLDRIFHNRTGITAFNRAVEMAGNQLGDDEYKAKVIIMIPYPFGEEPFGVIDGEEIYVSEAKLGAVKAAENRYKAVTWFIDEARRRWDEAGYERLELIGFYWNNEALSTTGLDFRYMPQVGEYLRSMGYNFSWIPWYKAPGYQNWEKAGFDAVMMQPNYMFSEWITRSRFEATVAEMKRMNMAIEMEASGRVLTQKVWRERYYDYLRAGVEYGFDGDVLRGWYQEINVLAQAALSENPEVREIYDNTYKFIKGEFKEGFGE